MHLSSCPNPRMFLIVSPSADLPPRYKLPPGDDPPFSDQPRKPPPAVMTAAILVSEAWSRVRDSLQGLLHRAPRTTQRDGQFELQQVKDT